MCSQLVPGLHQHPYILEERHYLLNEGVDHAAGPNIGHDGRNLTITFLSMSRVALSVRLLESMRKWIPSFAGTVLVIDNGSAGEEIQELKRVAATLPFRTLIAEQGENLGVGGGRNQAASLIETDWALFLDNDIYFIDNPIVKIQRELSTLGCHFMNLRLLNSDERTIFADGGHLYVSFDGSQIHAGAGSARMQLPLNSEAPNEPFLGTFLFGGACVLNVHTFKAMGGYDPALFIGFEDIDFSIRLFRAGYKVGCNSATALVHDHAPPESANDKQYERARFARAILKKSAEHLEKKYGFDFWTDSTDLWLESRHKELMIQIEDEEVNNLTTAVQIDSNTIKPTIALVVDTDNWAFANIANQLSFHLSDRFSFTIIPTEVVGNVATALIMTRNFDLTHFFWRETLHTLNSEYIKAHIHSLGFSWERFREKFVSNRNITTSVYDHLFLTKEEITERHALYNEIVSAYTVSSQRLLSIYHDISTYPEPSAVTEDGVDLTVFRPRNLGRFDNADSRPMIIGWAGNSRWASDMKHDVKGLATILLPAIKHLQDRGLQIKCYFADRNVRHIPHREMPDYYNSLDVYVCTSLMEGTPNPILEAMACGVPVITTDVGVTPQLLGKKQQEFILRNRSVEDLSVALEKLYNSRNQFLRQLSEENLKMITNWDWSIKAENFATFFEDTFVPLQV